MNRCRPEKMDTKEYGKMLNRIVILEEGRVPERKEKGWNVKGENRRVTRKECKRLREKLEVGGFMAQKEEFRPSNTETTENTEPRTKKTY